MRALKILLITVALILGSGATLVWWRFQSCLGAMSECYHSWQAFTSNADPMDVRRSSAIHGGFTASNTAVAFQAPISIVADDLVVIDRASKQARLIAPEGFTHWSPRFSDDGQRIVFARGHIGQPQRELVSCVVSTWHCVSLLETTGPLASPIDIGDGKVLVALGHPLVSVSDGKERRFPRIDLYIAASGLPPRRITNLNLLGMSSISLGANQLYFEAPTPAAIAQREGCTHPYKCDRSEIFRLDFDARKAEVVSPPASLHLERIVSQANDLCRRNQNFLAEYVAGAIHLSL